MNNLCVVASILSCLVNNNPSLQPIKSAFHKKVQLDNDIEVIYMSMVGNGERVSHATIYHYTLIIGKKNWFVVFLFFFVGSKLVALVTWNLTWINTGRCDSLDYINVEYDDSARNWNTLRSLGNIRILATVLYLASVIGWSIHIVGKQCKLFYELYIFDRWAHVNCKWKSDKRIIHIPFSLIHVINQCMVFIGCFIGC